MTGNGQIGFTNVVALSSSRRLKMQDQDWSDGLSLGELDDPFLSYMREMEVLTKMYFDEKSDDQMRDWVKKEIEKLNKEHAVIFSE